MNKLIGQNLRFLRKKRGYTLGNLASFLGVSQQQISKYEKGINKISAEDIYKLSNFLMVDINYFFVKPKNRP